MFHRRSSASSRGVSRKHERPATNPRDLAFGLEVLSDTGARAMPAAAPPPRRSRIVIAAGIVAVILVAAIAIWWTRGATPQPKRPAERRLGGEPCVLEHGEQREDARHLERPPEPLARAQERRLLRDVAPAQLDAPGRRPVEPREQVEERRLPRPVRADDAEQLALGNLERDIGDDLRAADVEPEVASDENRRVRHASFSSGRWSLGEWMDGRLDVARRHRLDPLRLPVAVVLLEERDDEHRLDQRMVGLADP